TKSIDSLFYSPISVHFWYLYAIVGIYLLIPAMSRIYFNSNYPERILIVAFWFIGVCVLPMLNSTGLNAIPPSLYGLNSISGYVGYIFIGRLIFDLKPMTGVAVAAIWITFVISTYLTWFLTVTYTNMSGKFNGMFYSYLSPFVVVSAVCLFYSILQIRVNSIYLTRFLTCFSSCALGIYCLQSMMINEVAYKLDIRATHHPAALWVPLVVIVTFLLCLAICLILLRVPFIKRMV
ncbi:TPA: acyltransferase family protein, partial [Escherichia coli]|nr:acyltransferase family protein [Escherichia coli]